VEPYRRWVPRVSRFSFRLGAAGFPTRAGESDH
jgi:hypothetical protein